MEKYIEGNKAAWEEAFDNRDRICSACKGLGRKRWNNLSSGIHDPTMPPLTFRIIGEVNRGLHYG